MSDYSSFSMHELQTMHKYVRAAYHSLQCPDSEICKDCCISDDCKALAGVRTHIKSEIFERKSKGGSHGEEKENRP